ncbi:hypothetical protein SAMN05519103_00696 [Rhizobiales bacterium GAS113]|nr:hypothetical protein SAMN05519103_00696 [Rhizobiales bacterium GAS113]
MVLCMSRPFKHPETGVYYFRKAVPDHLREALGKREEKRSLRTKEPAEARRKFAAVASEVERQCATLRSDAVSLTHKEAYALAGRWYGWFVSRFEDDPGSQTEACEGWSGRLAEMPR